MNAHTLDLWVVYFNAIDYPDKYIARLHKGVTPTDRVIVGDTLESVRIPLRDELQLHRMERMPNDQPHIVETWI